MATGAIVREPIIKVDKVRDDLLLAIGSLKDAANILRAERRHFDANLIHDLIESVEKASEEVTSGR